MNTNTTASRAKIVAMPTEVANEVRSTLKAPKYGFPAYVETPPMQRRAAIV